MDAHNETLCKGLHLIYLGVVISIATAFCALVSAALPPLALLFLLGTIGAGIASIVGLVKLRNEHTDYMSALIAMVVGLVLSLFSRGDSALAQVMDMASSVADLLEIYFVIRATNHFLEAKELTEQVTDGNTAWKWNWMTTAAAVIATPLVALSTINLGFAIVATTLALVLGVAGLASIYALFLYLGYLNAASKSL